MDSFVRKLSCFKGMFYGDKLSKFRSKLVAALFAQTVTFNSHQSEIQIPLDFEIIDGSSLAWDFSIFSILVWSLEFLVRLNEGQWTSELSCMFNIIITILLSIIVHYCCIREVQVQYLQNKTMLKIYTININTVAPHVTKNLKLPPAYCSCFCS